MRTVSLALLAALTLGLSACEGGGDPVKQAQQDALIANRAAAHPIDPALLANAAASTGAEAASSVDETYVTSMIANHREAMATAQAVLGQSQDAEIRRMAQSVIDSRSREIAELEAWQPTAR